MKSFVQLAFDLDGAQPADYGKIEGWLGSVYLKRIIDRPNQEPIRLPNNTFAGWCNYASSAREVFENVRKHVGIASQNEGLKGKAFLCVAGAAAEYESFLFDWGTIKIL